MLIQEIVSSDKYKYPKWLKKHKIFSSNFNFEKIFPSLGLENSINETYINSSIDVTPIAEQLLMSVQGSLALRKKKLTAFLKKAKKVSKVRQRKLNKLLELFHNTITLINSDYKNFIKKQDDGRLSIVWRNPIEIKKELSLKEGEGFFRAYNKINTFLEKKKCVKLPAIEQNYFFKEFSAKNVGGTNFKLVFSSVGEKGAWDIATMSMRGISSCQSWSGGQCNDRCVIGSMVDPFTAIIYLTKDDTVSFNEYGSKMNFRSIVRYVLDSHTKKGALLLERMYPAPSPTIISVFAEFLKQKTNLQVYYGPDLTSSVFNRLSIPLTAIVNTLGSTYYPYRDTHIEFKNLNNNYYNFNSLSSYNIDTKIVINVLKNALKNIKTKDVKHFFVSKDIKEKTLLLIGNTPESTIARNSFVSELSTTIKTFFNTKPNITPNYNIELYPIINIEINKIINCSKEVSDYITTILVSSILTLVKGQQYVE